MPKIKNAIIMKKLRISLRAGKKKTKNEEKVENGRKNQTKKI